MAAQNTDLFRKVSRRWVGQIGAGGVADAVVTTVPLSSATSLATDTAVTVVIDRVDANGTTTASLEETVIGVVSGSNLTSCLRGVEGTAQAHSAGAVVEVLVTSDGYNDMIDAILVDHGQLGRHKGLTDANGNEWIRQTATTSAVNDVTVANAATAGSPTLSATGDDTNINLLLDGKATGMVVPRAAVRQGFLLNGKIVPSVSSNNLTVALKTIQGNNPSAADPVYIRIGDTVRSVTAALSVTKNAGTNWFNSGGSETATIEIDYFVYLGYNATDGVVIGFSRIPNARQYSDFSATSTNDRYAGISTITTAASTDYYENIGRFAATLSAGAGYTWTVPTFTAINMIQRPVYETRWLAWTPTYTGSGSLTVSSITNNSKKYKIQGNQLFFTLSSTFTTGGTTSANVIFTVPMTMQNQAGEEPAGATRLKDGGGTVAIGFYLFQSTTSIATGFVGATWTLAAGAVINLSTFYEV